MNNFLWVVCNIKDFVIYGIIVNVNFDINCKIIINCMICNELMEKIILVKIGKKLVYCVNLYILNLIFILYDMLI